MDRSLVDLTDTTRQAFKEMRLLIYELRPSALAQGDLVQALQLRLDAVEKKAQVATDFQVDAGIDIPDSVEEEFYFIAEEALNNALKHAECDSIDVQITPAGEGMVVTIDDSGTGISEADLLSDRGISTKQIRIVE